MTSPEMSSHLHDAQLPLWQLLRNGKPAPRAAARIVVPISATMGLASCCIRSVTSGIGRILFVRGSDATGAAPKGRL